MIKYVKGDATQPIGTGSKLIVHSVNDIGAWGRGFVVAISRRWPHVETAYRRWAKSGSDFSLGAVQFVDAEPGIVVANLVGQHGIGLRNGPPVRYDAIRSGLEKVRNFVIGKDMTVNMPRIGCGLGGGDWGIIEKLINEQLAEVNVIVHDFEDNK